MAAAPRPQDAADRTARVPLYPVVLDVGGRGALVVGGGPVAARKAAALLACGARVTVVAPDMDRALVELGARTGASDAPGGGGPRSVPGTIALQRRRYRPGEAAGYRLVVTATGVAAVDGAVSADAEAAGVWVNSADDAANCTFLLPSVHRDGPVSIAVSTGGTSPAMATWLRRRLAAELGPGLATLADLLEEARNRLKSEGRSTEDVDWQALLDGPFPSLVRRGDLDEARRLLAAATGDRLTG